MTTTLLNCHKKWIAVFALVGMTAVAGLAQAQPGGRFGGRDRERGSGGERERGSSGERGPGGYGGDRGERRYGERGPGERGSEGRGGPGYGRDFGRGPTPSSSPSSGSSSRGGTSSGPSSVQGFGSSDKQAKAPGFDVPLEAPGGNLQDRYDKQVLDKTDKEVLPRFDTDKDGFISGQESEASDWEPPFADSDLDKDGRLSRFELYERYAKKLNLPPKTGVVYNAASGGAKPAENTTSGGGENQEKLAGYAKGFLVRYDKDKSGVLEKDKDEWKDLKPDFQAADTNKDNIITQEELTVKFASFGSGGSGGSSAGSATPSSAGSRGGGRWGNREGSGRPGEKGTADGRKSYRIPTATERLPKGLPDWFARNDTDADGQVMMAEYLTELTESKAAEFAKYDLNGDGIITPEECLESAGTAKRK